MDELKEIPEEFRNEIEELNKLQEEYSKLTDGSLTKRIKNAELQLDIIKRQLDKENEFTYEDFLKIKNDNQELYEDIIYYINAEDDEKELISSMVDVSKFEKNLEQIKGSLDLSHIADNMKVYKFPVDSKTMKSTMNRTAKKIMKKTSNNAVASMRIIGLDLGSLFNNLVVLFPEKNVMEHRKLVVSICKYIDMYINEKFIYIENVLLNIRLLVGNVKANTEAEISFRSQVEGLYSLLSH